MAVHWGRKVRARAEGRRIGAELGLGRHLATSDQSVQPYSTEFGELIVMIGAGAIIAGLNTVRHLGKAMPWALLVAGGIIALWTGMLAARPRRSRADWLHEYEAGLVQVAGQPQRMQALRWADLASMRLDIEKDVHDHQHVTCSLKDHGGHSVHVGRGRDELIGRVEQVLAGRLAGPLTGRLDAGQPVTIGVLTVDQAGIRCTGGHRNVPWNVAWQQVSDVRTERHGLEVTVMARHGRKAAALTARMNREENDFLIQCVLQHAARRAGVAFQAG
jgi:hypothetical protein